MTTKRHLSRFSTDELNQVINNWELVARENSGSLKVKKKVVDLRSPVHRALDKENISYIDEYVLYYLDILIPFKGKKITIQTSELKPPLFEYPVINNTNTFSIKDEDILDKFSKLFGTKELQVEDRAFDKKYFLETNNNQYLKSILDFKIRDWLKDNQIAYLDLNSERAPNKLSIFYFFNELDIEDIKVQIENFKYCIDKILAGR